MYFNVTVQLTAVTLTVDVMRMTAGTSVLKRDLKVVMRYAVPGRRGWSRKCTTSQGGMVYVRPSVPKKFLWFDDFDEIWYVGRGRWVMHDGIQYDPIQGQSQGHEPFKVGNMTIFNSYLIRHLQWELATDHWFLNYSTIYKFDRAGFLTFVLVFVSRDFELGTVRWCVWPSFQNSLRFQWN